MLDEWWCGEASPDMQEQRTSNAVRAASTINLEKVPKIGLFQSIFPCKPAALAGVVTRSPICACTPTHTAQMLLRRGFVGGRERGVLLAKSKESSKTYQSVYSHSFLTRNVRSWLFQGYLAYEAPDSNGRVPLRLRKGVGLFRHRTPSQNQRLRHHLLRDRGTRRVHLTEHLSRWSSLSDSGSQ